MTGRSQSKEASDNKLPKIVSTLPMFIAYCLFDGNSFPFHEFILNRIGLFGEAWGQEVLGRRIGHANESDAVYRGMRSAGRARKDKELAKKHNSFVRQHGSERHHVISEATATAKLLGLGRGDLPCIACEAGAGTRNISILRIRREWYRTDARQDILSDALRTGLRSIEIRRVISKLPMEADEMTRRMQQHLDGLGDRIDRRMHGIADPSTGTMSEDQFSKEIQERALAIDTNGQRVFAHGQPVAPTKLPFKLLLALAATAASPNAILSRDQANTALWEEEERAASALDSVVRRLRQELRGRSRGPRRTLSIEIETVRGRGWRLKLAPDDVLVV